MERLPGWGYHCPMLIDQALLSVFLVPGSEKMFTSKFKAILEAGTGISKTIINDLIFYNAEL